MRRLRDEGQMDLLPAKERISMAGELEKLEANLGGVAEMRKQPDAVFIIDLKKEQLAVREARRLNLPVIALVDTNCDPDEADFVVPGNDDAIRACALITRVIANAIAEGQQKVSVKDFQKQENGAAPSAEAAPAPEDAVVAETPSTEPPAEEPIVEAAAEPVVAAPPEPEAVAPLEESAPEAPEAVSAPEVDQ
jgi:small subunit ribosomal protein S2